MHHNKRRAAVVALGLILGTVTVQARTARRVPRLPKATAIPLQVGDVVSVGGQQYTVGVTLVPIGAAPTPTPIPNPNPTPITTITGIRNAITGQLVTSAVVGTPLQLEGTSLGTSGRLQFAGRIVASPSLWSDTKILFSAPDPGAAAQSGGWDLYWQVGNSWLLKASTAIFTLTPQGQPTPLPGPPLPTGPAPLPLGLSGPDGAPATKLLAGQAYSVTGSGFGLTPGKLWINASPATVTQWTDARISAIAPANIPAGVPVWVTVKRSDGAWHSSSVGR